LYRFKVITDYCLNFEHCISEHPFGGLGAWQQHLQLTGKRVDFPLVLI